MIFLKKCFERIQFFLCQRVFKTEISWGLLFLIFFFFGTLLFFQKEISLQKGTDDMIFYERTHQVPYDQWIVERYLGWSGRVVAEMSLYVFLHLPIWIEKAVNAGMIILFVYTVNRLFKRRVGGADFIFTLCLFGLIGQRVLTSSTFAFHAAPNYFWPITLGLFSYIPLADIFFKRKKEFKNGEYFLYGSALIFAVFSNEQILLVLLGFYCLFLGYLFLKKQIIPKWVLIYGAILLFAFANMLFAPGNNVRYGAEITRWYPEFSQMTWGEKVERGGVWFYKKFFFEQKYIVLLLGAMTCIAYWKQTGRRNFLLEGLVLFPVATLYIEGIQSFKKLLFDFNDSKNFSYEDLGFYLYWTAYLGVLIFSLVRADRRNIFYGTILFAGMASMWVMIASPTIYASANRILLMNSVLCIVLINALRIHHKFPIKTYLFPLALFSLIHLALLFALWEKKGFHIYY